MYSGTMPSTEDTKSVEAKKSEAFFLARRAEAIYLDAVRAYSETHQGELPSCDQVAKLAEEAFRAARVFTSVAAHPRHVYERARLAAT